MLFDVVVNHELYELNLSDADEGKRSAAVGWPIADFLADTRVFNSEIATQIDVVDVAATVASSRVDCLINGIFQLHLHNESHDATICVGDTKFEVYAGSRSGQLSIRMFIGAQARLDVPVNVFQAPLWRPK